eukprot:scaffold1119_cov120-Cylindrotheca_fusiformis.AAC.15
MMHSVEYGNHHDNDSSDTSTADLFSPSHGRLTSLHPTTPDRSAQKDELLPRLQDTSWIGARVSPIPSYDEDEENDYVTARYRKALNDSSSVAFMGATESTSLLRNFAKNKTKNIWSLHPLWDPHQDPLVLEQKRLARKSPTYRLGMLVVGSTATFLAVVALHDGYLWYISYRRGVALAYSLAWRWPWLSPTKTTLLRFGAFSPQRLVQQRDYWRIGTSWFVTTSVVEWLLTAWGWWCVQYISTGIIIWPLYVLCCATGQLWMAAFQFKGISGCACWGTSGVLCAIGVARPDRRFVLFLTAIASIVLSLLEPTSSVYGAIGSIFFGWSFNSVGLTLHGPSATDHDKDDHGKMSEFNIFAALIVVGLWVLPILHVLYMNDDSD